MPTSDQGASTCEKLVRASGPLLQEILDYIPALVCLKDPAGRFVLINRRFEEVVRCTRSQVIGKTAYDFQPKEIADRFAAHDQEVLDSGEPQAYEEEATVDGERRTYVSVKFALRDAQGERCGVCTISADITERQRLEALRHEREQLLESEERFRQAASAGKVGVYNFDCETRAVFWTPELRALAGLTAEAIPAYEDYTPSIVHPADKERFAGAMHAALDPRGSGGFEVRHRIVRADGALRWVLVRGKVFFTGEGAARHPVRAIGAVIDITELEEAEEALKEADRHKDEFLAMLGHELRNPLAPITNVVRLLRAKRGEESDIRWAVELIDRQLEQLRRLVNDLMDISRISRGTLELRWEPVDIGEVIVRAVEMSQPAIEARKHTLERSLAALGHTLVKGDRGRLMQVIGNLLDNAARYTPEGGRIQVVAERKAETAVICVRDTGIGLSPDELPRVFDAFRQVRPAPGVQAGLGLGLALVKRLTEMHGGTVEVMSPGKGMGSEFVVRLPQLREDAAGSADAPS